MDKISIVVPCYNMEKKVKCCIDSIKKQSHKNFEVLMIDDGSKDKTAEVLLFMLVNKILQNKLGHFLLSR